MTRLRPRSWRALPFPKTESPVTDATGPRKQEKRHSDTKNDCGQAGDPTLNPSSNGRTANMLGFKRLPTECRAHPRRPSLTPREWRALHFEDGGANVAWSAVVATARHVHWSAITRLADALGRSRSGVHDELRRLVASGLVTAASGPRGTILTLAGLKKHMGPLGGAPPHQKFSDTVSTRLRSRTDSSRRFGPPTLSPAHRTSYGEDCR
jgi:hypothetical protein